VAVKATKTLEHQVCRGNVCHHQVEIEVEALLDDLCRHEHRASGTVHHLRCRRPALRHLDCVTWLTET
jgi:hypothetical protein